MQLGLEDANSFDDGVMKVIPGATSQDESQIFERADDESDEDFSDDDEEVHDDMDLLAKSTKNVVNRVQKVFTIHQKSLLKG